MAKYTLLLPNGSKKSFPDAGFAVIEAMGNDYNVVLKGNYADALRRGSTITINGITIVPENMKSGEPAVTWSTAKAGDVLKGFGALFIMFFGFYIMGLIKDL